MGHSSGQKLVYAALQQITSAEEEVLTQQTLRILVDGWVTKKTHFLHFDSDFIVDIFGAVDFSIMPTQSELSGTPAPSFKNLKDVFQATDAAIHHEGVELPSYFIYNKDQAEVVVMIEEKCNIPVRAGQQIIHNSWVNSFATYSAGILNIQSVCEVTIACHSSTRLGAYNSKNAPTRNAVFVRTNDATSNVFWKLPCNGRIGNIRVLWNPGSNSVDNMIVVGRAQFNHVFFDEHPDFIVLEDGDDLMRTHGIQSSLERGIITNHYSDVMFFKKHEHFGIWSRDDEGGSREYIVTWDFIPEFNSEVDFTWQIGDAADDVYDQKFMIPFDMYVEKLDVDWHLDGTTSTSGIIFVHAIKPGTPLYGSTPELRDAGALAGVQNTAINVMDKLPSSLGQFGYALTGVSEAVVVKTEIGADVIEVHDYWPAGTVIAFYHESITGTGSPEVYLQIDGKSRIKHNNWGNHYYTGEGVFNQEALL